MVAATSGDVTHFKDARTLPAGSASRPRSTLGPAPPARTHQQAGRPLPAHAAHARRPKRAARGGRGAQCGKPVQGCVPGRWRARQSNHNKACCALANKLARIAYACLRDHAAYDEEKPNSRLPEEDRAPELRDAGRRPERLTQTRLNNEYPPSLAQRLIAHHGTPVTPTAPDADNPSGSFTPAARNDWRSADADSMSARAPTRSPPQMPDIRLQAQPFVHYQIDQSLRCGESISTGWASRCLLRHQTHLKLATNCARIALERCQRRRMLARRLQA